jgi:hypothetical protein
VRVGVKVPQLLDLGFEAKRDLQRLASWSSTFLDIQS